MCFVIIYIFIQNVFFKNIGLSCLLQEVSQFCSALIIWQARIPLLLHTFCSACPLLELAYDYVWPSKFVTFRTITLLHSNRY